MRHAVIGAGFGAHVHLPAFSGLSGVTVVALADAGSGRAAAAAAPGVAAYSDWRRLLDEVRPDSVSVVAPPAAQSEIVAAAIDRGIHVLCEKPLGLNLADATRLTALASSSPVVTAVGFQYRFGSGMAALRRHLGAGIVGPVRRFDFSWITSGRADPARPWSWQHDDAAGGGVISGFLSHAADLLHWHGGLEPVAVMARTAILISERPDGVGAPRPVAAEDAVEVLCDLAGGAVASFRITNCQAGGDGMRIEVHGEAGILRYHHRPPFAEAARLSLDMGTGSTELVSENVAAGNRDTRLDPMRRLAGLFVEAAGGAAAAELPVFRDALRSQRLLAAARESAAAGRRVVLQ